MLGASWIGSEVRLLAISIPRPETLAARTALQELLDHPCRTSRHSGPLTSGILALQRLETGQRSIKKSRCALSGVAMSVVSPSAAADPSARRS
jgi:hypothetical protein